MLKDRWCVDFRIEVRSIKRNRVTFKPVLIRSGEEFPLEERELQSGDSITFTDIVAFK